MAHDWRKVTSPYSVFKWRCTRCGEATQEEFKPSSEMKVSYYIELSGQRWPRELSCDEIILRKVMES